MALKDEQEHIKEENQRKLLKMSQQVFEHEKLLRAGRALKGMTPVKKAPVETASGMLPKGGEGRQGDRLGERLVGTLERENRSDIGGGSEDSCGALVKQDGVKKGASATGASATGASAAPSATPSGKTRKSRAANRKGATPLKALFGC